MAVVGTYIRRSRNDISFRQISGHSRIRGIVLQVATLPLTIAEFQRCIIDYCLLFGRLTAWSPFL